MKIKKYDIALNFWETYPEVKSISPFKEFRLADKKAANRVSSKYMWAFAAYTDVNSPLYNMPEDERISVIEDDYIGRKFDLRKFEKHISVMRRLLLSKEHVALDNLIKKLEERTKLIQDTEYTIENADKLDKLIGNTKTLLKAIKDMESMIESGAADGNVKGGRTESISEQGVI
jgi:hypothetical protein